MHTSSKCAQNVVTDCYHVNRSFTDKKWYCFNDQSVTTVSNVTITSHCGVMLSPKEFCDNCLIFHTIWSYVVLNKWPGQLFLEQFSQRLSSLS